MLLALDTSAIMRFFLNERGHEQYRSLILDNRNAMLITSLVLYEIKNVFLRLGRPRDEIIAALAYAKDRCELHPITESIALRAAELKYKYSELDRNSNNKVNMSLADAILVAMAEEKQAKVFSADSNLRKVTEVQFIS